MDSYKERVIQEKSDLDVKIEKLTSFVVSDKFVCLSEKEQTLLVAQKSLMEDYSRVLGERILLF